MGIVLDEEATAAWKEAGESWEAVSSRIITMRMKLARASQRKPGGGRETSNIFVTVISVYAPTARAPLRVAQKFMEDLQETIDKVPKFMEDLQETIHMVPKFMEDLQETIDKVPPASDILLLLGDFNARVGASSVSDDDLWRGVRVKYGVGV